jgi:GNAT superfamily N-acetyltransferase
MTDGIRPMQPEDIAGAQDAWYRALNALHAELPLLSRLPAVSPAAYQQRLSHVLDCDSRGCWVAEADGQVVGLAQALRRGGLWVLSVFGVAPGWQGKHFGVALLERALEYAEPSTRCLILSSLDPRAIRRYVRAGFTLLPAMVAVGTPAVSAPMAPDVRPGDEQDFSLAGQIDVELRGGEHGPDLQFILRAPGAEMLVVEERGYAISVNGSPALIAARDEGAARQLLRATLARASGPVTIPWVTALQQWAVGEALDAQLRMQAHGPVMVKGWPEFPLPYIANTSFG